MKSSPPPVVEHKLISSGMSAGSHKKIAITGVLASIALAVISKSPTMAIGIFMLSSSIGLIGEAIAIYSKSELVVRRRFPRHPPAFVLIKRENHPRHFFFHLISFGTIGVICFVMGAIYLFAALVFDKA